MTAWAAVGWVITAWLVWGLTILLLASGGKLLQSALDRCNERRVAREQAQWVKERDMYHRIIAKCRIANPEALKIGELRLLEEWREEGKKKSR